MIELIRKARKNIDGADGVVVLHAWQTGHQYLIFPTWEKALQWFAKSKEVVL